MIDLLTIQPDFYNRDYTPCILGTSTAADRYTLLIPAMGIRLGSLIIPVSEQEINLNNSDNWDDSQYATPANRAGLDFYYYVTANGIILSNNSTYPDGYSEITSSKIGGFHCLCVSAGTISGHSLTGFVTGDILTKSVWDKIHRPKCSPEGMVYSNGAMIWVDIYLQSGTGSSTASVYGGTITDSLNWMDYVDDLAAVGKRMLSDAEFQVAAAGSNEETNIAGSADPTTTGGHVDTAGRRMISGTGGEDMCGAMWQWLADQSYTNDDASYSGAWSYYDLPGSKGSLYKQSSGRGDVKLLAGGAWSSGTNCGSRARSALRARWYAETYLGSRGCCNSL